MSGPLPRSAVLLDVLLVLLAFLVDGAAFHGDRTVVGGDVPLPLTLAVTAVCAASLLVRRRHPLVPFAVWWVYGLVPLLVIGREPFAGLLIAVATVASRCRRRVSTVVLVLASVPFGANAYAAVRGAAPGEGAETAGQAVPFWLALPAAAWGIGRVIRLLRDREQLSLRLHEAELETTLRDERLRLARDLHDIVAHSVSAMILQAAGARSLSTDTDVRVRSALRSIETTGADSMKELHRLLGLLRETGTDAPQLTARPGLSDIERILTTTRACGVLVELATTGTPRRLDPEVSHTAFRMVQECMANVIKHGGAGARSTVAIAWLDDGVEITVRNDEHDAVNASMLSGGFGLQGLTERVREVGGRFVAGPADESIFVVSMSLPLRVASGPSGGG